MAKNPGGKAVAYINGKSARGEAVSSIRTTSTDYGSQQDFYPAGGAKKPRGSALRALDPNQDIYCFRFDREAQFRNLLDWYSPNTSPKSENQQTLGIDEQIRLRKSGDEHEERFDSAAEGRTNSSIVAEFGEPPDDDLAKLSLYARKVRLGQASFRDILLELYGNKCAVSRQGPTVVLEAAHIWEHALSGVNHSSNGILLRADIHILFDDGLIKIHPESLKVMVSPELVGTGYEKLHGSTLLPRIDGSRPSAEYLAKRYS